MDRKIQAFLFSVWYYRGFSLQSTPQKLQIPTKWPCSKGAHLFQAIRLSIFSGVFFLRFVSHGIHRGFPPDLVEFQTDIGNSFNSICELVTALKFNMEPTNHPFRKENDLPGLHDYVPAVNLPGCIKHEAQTWGTDDIVHFAKINKHGSWEFSPRKGRGKWSSNHL